MYLGDELGASNWVNCVMDDLAGADMMFLHDCSKTIYKLPEVKS